MPFLSVRRTLHAAGLVVLTLGALARESSAQSSPADLFDMSLSELLEVEIITDSAEPVEETSQPERLRWNLSYRYVRGTFSGYRDGTSRVSNSSLLGPANGTTYPVLQKEVIQEAHVFDLSYELSEQFSLDLIVPYIRQQTDHESIVPGFSKFTIRSDGIGDVSLSLSDLVYRSESTSLTLNAGLSIPTGSIRETGHTPSGPGSQLPYTMQLGSGTWDIPLGASFRSSLAGWRPLGPVELGLQASGKIRVGNNSRGYRLGHRLLLGASASVRPVAWLEPSFRVSGEIWGRIHGTDRDFPGPVFPTPVADPSQFGGERVSLILGVKFLILRKQGESSLMKFLGGQSFKFEVGFPVYQRLNGPQPEENWRFLGSWGMRF